MQLISTALEIEAKPLINFYKLKKTNYSSFDIWENENKKLIITGVGKLRAAIAISYLFGLSKNVTSFLNLGICGHKNLEIGTLVFPHKIKDSANGKNIIYPSILFENLPCDTFPLMTVDSPCSEYENDYCYDMEAFGFFTAAVKFLTIDLVYSLKIVTDNNLNHFNKVSKEEIFTLIYQNIEKIDEIIKKIDEISLEYIRLKDSKIDIDSFFHRWCFSISEKYKLKDILEKIKSLNPNLNALELIKNLNDCQKSCEVINSLEKKIKVAPLLQND